MSRNARIQILLFALLGWMVPAGALNYVPFHATNPSARVVIAEGENLLNAYLADDARVEEVFNRGLTHFTRTTNVAAAWRSLVASNDVVGIKVYSAPGPLTGSRPAVVAAVVHGLRAAGLPASQIIIWDKRTDELRAAGFFQK